MPHLGFLHVNHSETLTSRVHNIKREGECRMHDRPRTNTLRKVESVNS